jgi:hypothetical protein
MKSTPDTKPPHQQRESHGDPVRKTPRRPVWHLRRAWAPLTFTDETPPDPANPVAPAVRSDAATTKASRRTDTDNRPVRSFRALLDHLSTLTRNDIAYGTTDGPVVPTLTQPTDTQRRAFALLEVPIALHLAAK